MTDPIADMLTRIRNAVTAKHTRVDMPASRLKVEIARILQDEGYIQGYRIVEQTVPGGRHSQQVIRLFLKYGPRGERVTTGRDPHGDSFAKIQVPGMLAHALIPAEVCSLAAGKDAWKRSIAFKCKGCGERHPAELLYNMTDLPGHCAKCSHEYFYCQKCKHEHHPDDPCNSTLAIQHQYTSRTEGGAK